MFTPAKPMRFFSFSIKTMIIHTATYFAFGIIMSNVFNYKDIFNLPVIRDFMRPIDSPFVLAGPFLQPIRGFLYALVLWPIRNIFLEKKYGWFSLWSIFLAIGILGTPAAAPCSMEGVIYSKLPLWYHGMGLIEMVLQTLSFSFLLVWWFKKSKKNESNPELSRKKALSLRVMFAVAIGCFGYIGYAIGSIVSAKMVGYHINLGSAAFDVKGQLMFVFAFIINVIVILVISSKKYLGKISSAWVFLIFVAIDVLFPFFYRLLLYGHMLLSRAFVIGFLPAVVIYFSYKLYYKNFEKLNQFQETEKTAEQP
jgi:hypothetical protein